MAGPDTEFGVQTSNLFSLLDDDAPAPAKKEPVKKAAPAKAQVNNRGSDREKRNDRRPERSQRGGGRGRGRGRGRGGESRGRAFDRRSGTGRDKSQPKGGHGKGNWGTDKDDQAREARRNWRQEKQEKQAATGETEKVEGDAAATETPEGEDAKAPEVTPEEEEQEKEPDTIGYEEFLAQKAAKAPDDDSNKVLRSAENDESQWEACAEITKEEDDEESFLGVGFSTTKKSRGKKGNKGKNAKKVKSLDEFNSTTRSSGRGR